MVGSPPSNPFVLYQFLVRLFSNIVKTLMFCKVDIISSSSSSSQQNFGNISQPGSRRLDLVFPSSIPIAENVEGSFT